MPALPGEVVEVELEPVVVPSSVHIDELLTRVTGFSLPPRIAAKHTDVTAGPLPVRLAAQPATTTAANRSVCNLPPHRA